MQKEKQNLSESYGTLVRHVNTRVGLMPMCHHSLSPESLVECDSIYEMTK